MLCKKWIRTVEDWYPTPVALWDPINGSYANPYPYPAACVQLIRHHQDMGWKILVRGGDDFGLEKKYDELLEATRSYEEITHYTTQEILEARGFTHA